VFAYAVALLCSLLVRLSTRKSVAVGLAQRRVVHGLKAYVLFIERVVVLFKALRFFRRNESGFTLIELLIVIVILGLLMSLVAPAMFSKVDSTKVKTAAAQLQMFQVALDTYRLDVGQYPASLEDLRSSDKPNWDGPYLPKAIPKDPWGNAYQYSFDSQVGEYSLLSYGSDGVEGGDADSADIIAE
jgi:general secretion pathway protein G